MSKPSKGLDKDGKPVLHSESQSLTNVLGFQAGGPNVMVPVISHNNNDMTLNFANEVSNEESASPDTENARANVIMAKVQKKS